MHGSLTALFLLTGFQTFFCADAQRDRHARLFIDGDNLIIRTLNGQNLSSIDCGEYDILTIQDGNETIRIQARVEKINTTGTEKLGFTAIAILVQNRKLEIQYRGKSDITRLLDGRSLVNFTTNLTDVTDSVTREIQIRRQQLPGNLQVFIHFTYSNQSFLESGVQIANTTKANYTVDGILGNNNRSSMKLIYRSGLQLPENPSVEQMQSYLRSWRIPSQSKSLFTYNGSRTFVDYSNISCLTPPTTTTKPPASKASPSTSGHQGATLLPQVPMTTNILAPPVPIIDGPTFPSQSIITQNSKAGSTSFSQVATTPSPSQTSVTTKAASQGPSSLGQSSTPKTPWTTAGNPAGNPAAVTSTAAPVTTTHHPQSPVTNTSGKPAPSNTSLNVSLTPVATTPNPSQTSVTTKAASQGPSSLGQSSTPKTPGTTAGNPAGNPAAVTSTAAPVTTTHHPQSPVTNTSGKPAPSNTSLNVSLTPDSLTLKNCSMKRVYKVGNLFRCDNSTVNGIGFCLVCDGNRDCDQGQDENKGMCDLNCFEAEKQGCQNAASTSVLQTSIVLLSLGLGLYGRGNIS